MRTGSLISKQGEIDYAQTDMRESNRSLGRGTLAVVGLGPGDREHMTLKALQALAEAEVVVGYKTYLDLISDLLLDKEIVSSAMTREVERCREGVRLAKEGKKVALVSSGDPGIYGMAGILLEVLSQEGGNESIDIEIIPGITAANAAAASLGAPIMHDFAVISLSDLLTPWETIIKRVEYAALGDFVVAIYNPKSKKRVQQILAVQEILLRYKSPQTPVGLVRNAKRGDEEMIVTTLQEFTDKPIDMFTTILIGNSQTFISGEKMITPRGYQL